MRTYAIKSNLLLHSLARNSKLIRDLPEGVEPPIQASYLNMVMGMFLRKLVKVYADEDLSDGDRAKLRKYLERIFEAKDALLAKEPKREL